MQFPNKAARQDYLLKLLLEEEIAGGGVDLEWKNIKNKPAVIAEGANEQEARDSIGAGTSSFSGNYSDLSGIPSQFPPQIGTTATTAMAGNTALFSGNYADLQGIPSTFPPQIGTTATTAMAGNTQLFSGNYSDLQGIPNTFAPAIGTTATTAMAGNKEATATERGGVLKVAAPDIQIDDPVDDDNIREQFDKLLASLKSAGVFS